MDLWPTHLVQFFFVGPSYYYAQFELSTNKIVQVYVFIMLLWPHPHLVVVYAYHREASKLVLKATVAYLGKFAMPITAFWGGLGSRSW